MKNTKPIKSNIRQSLGFRLKERMPVKLDCGDERRTKQAFKDEVDINNIVAKFADGVVPVMNTLEPQYGDSPTMDLKEALDNVFQARSEFNNLSDEQKSLFDNDENLYFEFLNNPDGFVSEIARSFEAEKASKSSSDSPSEEPSETG